MAEHEKVYEKVGERIRERLILRGYVKADGELDLERFGWDYRLGKTNLYNWIANKYVPFKDLRKLCDGLDCTADWLLFGEERDPKAQPGKARRHGKVKSLLLALGVGLGALLPPPSVGRELIPPPTVGDDGNNPSYRKRRDLGMACA